MSWSTVVVAPLASLLLAAQTLVCAQSPPPRPYGERLRLVPQNEAEFAPGFAPVAARVAAAVRARDANAILAIVSDDVQMVPGGDERGREAFRRHWNLDDRSSRFWTSVEEILAGGSSFDGECDNPEVTCYVTYPYWSERFPDRLDRLYYLVIHRADAPLYAQPRAGAAVVDRLSYDVVRRVFDSDVASSETWTEVVRLDGRRGFVRTSDTYNPTFGVRMIVQRSASGAWEVVGVIAGD